MKKVGSYVLLGEIAAGGMASVHLGRLSGPAGFSRTVAIKRLHPQFAKDPEFVSMFLDEARVAARIRHPNVVQTLDVVAADGELFLVMDYVEGEALSRVLKRLSVIGQRIPHAIVSTVISGTLRGLHAAHEAKGDFGEPLEIVHRDVSPQNVMLGGDGVVRVLDFGIAKAVGRLQTTREGAIKGKLPYMAPEQLRGLALTARADVYAVGVVLWECLVGERLFGGDEAHVVERILLGTVPLPSTRAPGIPPALDAIVAKATARAPNERFASAAEMAIAIEGAIRPAHPPEVAAWIDEVAGASLRTRAARVHEQLQNGNANNESLVNTPTSLESALRSSEQKKQEQVDVVVAAAAAGRTPRGAERRRIQLAVLAFACACAFGFGIAATRSGASASPDAPSPSIPPATSDLDGAPPASSTTLVEPPLPSAAAASAASSSSASPSGPPSSSVSASGPPKPPPRPKPVARPVTKPRADCTIPYTVDATGKRNYRRECLK